MTLLTLVTFLILFFCSSVTLLNNRSPFIPDYSPWGSTKLLLRSPGPSYGKGHYSPPRPKLFVIKQSRTDIPNNPPLFPLVNCHQPFQFPARLLFITLGPLFPLTNVPNPSLMPPCVPVRIVHPCFSPPMLSCVNLYSCGSYFSVM